MIDLKAALIAGKPPAIAYKGNDPAVCQQVQAFFDDFDDAKNHLHLLGIDVAHTVLAAKLAARCRLVNKVLI